MDWLVLISIGILLIVIVSGRMKPATAFSSLAVIYLTCNLVTLPTFLNSFTNPALATLVLLLILSLVFERANLLEKLASKLLRGGEKFALIKLLITTSTLSAFLNNTAVVSTLLSHVAKQTSISPSRLLIPLSYASILGGITTLIGTSTNLVVNSFMINAGLPELTLFQFSQVGIPIAIISLIALYFAARLLPKSNETEQQENQNQYFLTAKVEPNSPLINKTIEANKLRNLEGLYLVEIERNNTLISPVAPNERIQQNDLLMFSGEISKASALQNFEGLTIGDQKVTQVFNNNLVEVIISNQSELAGKTLQSVDFRTMFNAAVIGIRRGDKKLKGQLGRIPLKVGDSLLITAGANFKNHRNLDRNFHILTKDHYQPQINTLVSSMAVLGFIGVLILSLMQILPLFTGLLLLLGILIGSKVLSLSEVRRRFPFEHIVIIGSALIIAQGLQQSGAAHHITHLMRYLLEGRDVYFTLIILYLMTWGLTEIITNNAAAALSFPIALSIAQSLQLDPFPFIMTVAFAASACFLIPFGYQTHLMVYSAGRYTIKHFLKVGSIISLVYFLCTINLVYFVYISP